MPGSPPEQDYAAGDEAAAEDAIEFLDAGRKARCLLRHRRSRARRTVPVLPATLWKRAGGGCGDGFDQRVPHAAMRALALPLRALAAALGAGVDSLGLGHVRRVGGQSNSSGVTTAVPSLPTTTPAA